MSSASDLQSSSSPAEPERASCGAPSWCGDELLVTGSALLDPRTARYTECALHTATVPGSGASATEAFAAGQVVPDLARWHVALGEQVREPGTAGRPGLALARTRAGQLTGAARGSAAPPDSADHDRAAVSPVLPELWRSRGADSSARAPGAVLGAAVDERQVRARGKDAMSSNEILCTSGGVA